MTRPRDGAREERLAWWGRVPLWLGLVAGLSVAVIAIFLHARAARAREERRIAQFGQMLAASLWNMNAEGTSEALRPIVQLGTYRSVRMEHRDHRAFIEVQRKGGEPSWHRALRALGIELHATIQRPIVFRRNHIGYITVQWESPHLPLYALLVLCAMLGILIVRQRLRALATRREAAAAHLALEEEGRRRAEARLETREQQLLEVRRLEALGRLAGGVAHDFNNLLLGVMGTAELISMDSHDDGIREDLQVIMDVCERGARFTRRLLAFSRGQVLRPENVEINAQIRDIYQLLKRLLGDTVSLELELDSAAGYASVDPSQFDQILMNLAVNARDAVAAEGTVTIRTGQRELTPGSAEKWVVPAGSYVFVEVSDDGCGMDEATRAKVFEPFFTTRVSHGGSGLGLSTVYGIVRQSSGDIAVVSEPGQGATFTVLFPLAIPQAGPAELAERPERVRYHRPEEVQVLLVDDHPTVRNVTAEALRRVGYKVEEATDGRDAMERLIALPTPPQVLVTDLSMPRMGGRELVRRVRQVVPKIKVLYITARLLSADDAEIREGPSVAVLGKPFRMEALETHVATLLEGG